MSDEASARPTPARPTPARPVPARPVSITACPDGPLLVRGELALFDEQGKPVQPSRRTFALCRCGASTIRPFCDGSHKLVGFHTTAPARTPAVTFEVTPPVATSPEPAKTDG